VDAPSPARLPFLRLALLVALAALGLVAVPAAQADDLIQLNGDLPVTLSGNNVYGLLYLDGHGVPQDPAEAAKWFTKSAEQDYTQAQHNLGAMYGAGQGVKRDYVQAYKWLNICAAKGNAGCENQRDLIAKKLKASQLTAAQRMSSEFTPKKEPEK